MTQLIPSQLRDALHYIEGLGDVLESLPDKPAWDGSGFHLILPAVIPLITDGGEKEPVAWLVANDFDGYDLTTTDPEAGL